MEFRCTVVAATTDYAHLNVLHESSVCVGLTGAHSCLQMNFNIDVLPDAEICFSSSTDKMGIKTTVHEIISAKQNMSIPDPVTHDDFLKCKSFMCLNMGSDAMETRPMSKYLWCCL